MKEFRYATCDVFTDHVFTGNLLAVLTDARGLDDQTIRRSDSLATNALRLRHARGGSASVMVSEGVRKL